MRRRFLVGLGVAVLPLLQAIAAAPAQALLPGCSSASSASAAPQAVLERFVSANCADCWRDRAPTARRNELALDWIVPHGQADAADEAPLAPAAVAEAVERLLEQNHTPPVRAQAWRVRTGPELPAGATLRLAQGPVVQGYLGVSVEPQRLAGGPWSAWVLLVEAVAAGQDGSGVARNLVRGAFRTEWQSASSQVHGPVLERRAMRVPDSAQAPHLRLVGLLQDARGRLRAVAMTRCAAAP